MLGGSELEYSARHIKDQFKGHCVVVVEICLGITDQLSPSLPVDSPSTYLRNGKAVRHEQRLTYVSVVGNMNVRWKTNLTNVSCTMSYFG